MIGSDGKSSALPPQTFTSSGIASGAPYGNFTMSVTGQLKGISVEGLSGTKTVVNTDLTAVSADAVSRYGGWTSFENLADFEITWSGDAATGNIGCCNLSSDFEKHQD